MAAIAARRAVLVPMTVRLRHGWICCCVLRAAPPVLSLPRPLRRLACGLLNAALRLPRTEWRPEGGRRWRDAGRVGMRLEVPDGD